MSTTQTIQETRPAKRALDAEVGRRVHMMMWDRGLTQTSFGAQLGMDQSTLGKKLRGKVGWSLGEIAAVASALNVSISQLFGENGDGNEPDPAKVRPTDYEVAGSAEANGSNVTSLAEWRQNSLVAAS